jgi:hypothetical protein
VFEDGKFAAFAVLSSYAVAIAYLSEVVLGIAVWNIFKRRAIRSPLAFAIVGAVMGGLVFFYISGEFRPDSSHPYFWRCIVAGFSSATLFRVIVFSGKKLKADQLYDQNRSATRHLGSTRAEAGRQ